MNSIKLQSEIYVSYSQISVFNPAIDNPFNDWTEQHVTQGFSWRTGSVSFGTLEESGTFELIVQEVDEIKVDKRSVLGILVPFTTTDTLVEIASITDSQTCEIRKGNFALLFETFLNNGKVFCQFSFKIQDRVEPKILAHDSILCPQYPLLMDAKPAV